MKTKQNLWRACRREPAEEKVKVKRFGSPEAVRPSAVCPMEMSAGGEIDTFDLGEELDVEGCVGFQLLELYDHACVG